jgi:hypothetical protein
MRWRTSPPRTATTGTRPPLPTRPLRRPPLSAFKATRGGVITATRRTSATVGRQATGGTSRQRRRGTPRATWRAGRGLSVRSAFEGYVLQQGLVRVVCKEGFFFLRGALSLLAIGGLSAIVTVIITLSLLFPPLSFRCFQLSPLFLCILL